MEIESRYKACTIGGGDSSIQITSCDSFFARLANKWATVLTLFLANFTCDHQIPFSKQSTFVKLFYEIFYGKIKKLLTFLTIFLIFNKKNF